MNMNAVREDDQRKKTAIRAARAAGDELRLYKGRALNVSYKRAIDPVTDADRAAEAVILRIIREVYPEEPILSEESAPQGVPDSGWVIDPLDGTTNFSRGYPLFGPSIAWLNEDGRVDLGVVYNPLLDELYWAVRGSGAWCNERRLHVSQTSALNRALLSSGAPYDVQERPAAALDPWAELLPRALSLRQDGSAALDLCHVAAGYTDAHFEVGLAPWDVAAGILLVEEAGGRVTTYQGAPFALTSASILASNGLLHETLLETLHGVSL